MYNHRHHGEDLESLTLGNLHLKQTLKNQRFQNHIVVVVASASI